MRSTLMRSTCNEISSHEINLQWDQLSWDQLAMRSTLTRSTYNDVTRMKKLRGHSMGTLSVCVTCICYGTWGIHLPWKFFFIIHSEIASEAIFGHKCDLLVCSLHVRTKLAIAHANAWFLTVAFYIIFIRAPANFTWAQAWLCPGVAMRSILTRSFAARSTHFFKFDWKMNTKQNVLEYFRSSWNRISTKAAYLNGCQNVFL